MWKRERMMVDVISLQKAEEHSTCSQSSPLSSKMNTYNMDNKNGHDTNNSIPASPQLQKLQNRHYYPFQGIHDTQTRFYPGYEYDVFGEHSVDPSCMNNNNDRRKRPLVMITDNSSGDSSHINRNNDSSCNMNTKKQKTLASPQEESFNTTITSLSSIPLSTSTSTSTAVTFSTTATDIDATITTYSSSASSGYSFSSKPYDAMDNVMYYY